LSPYSHPFLHYINYLLLTIGAILKVEFFWQVLHSRVLSKKWHCQGQPPLLL
jgi:hypothetical protein